MEEDCAYWEGVKNLHSKKALTSSITNFPVSVMAKDRT